MWVTGACRFISQSHYISLFLITLRQPLIMTKPNILLIEKLLIVSLKSARNGNLPYKFLNHVIHLTVNDTSMHMFFFYLVIYNQNTITWSKGDTRDFSLVTYVELLKHYQFLTNASSQSDALKKQTDKVPVLIVFFLVFFMSLSRINMFKIVCVVDIRAQICLNKLLQHASQKTRRKSLRTIRKEILLTQPQKIKAMNHYIYFISPI